MNPKPSVVMSIVVRIAFSSHSASSTYSPWNAHTSSSGVLTCPTSWTHKHSSSFPHFLCTSLLECLKSVQDHQQPQLCQFVIPKVCSIAPTAVKLNVLVADAFPMAYSICRISQHIASHALETMYFGRACRSGIPCVPIILKRRLEHFAPATASAACRDQ